MKRRKYFNYLPFMKIGYARVSTDDQNLGLQIRALEEAGCEAIFQEHITGTLKARPELLGRLPWLWVIKEDYD